MKLFRKFCGFLLVTVMTVTVSVYVLDGTLLNAHYLESKASSSSLYGSLATTLPAAMAGSGPGSAVIKQNLASIITSTYVQSKLDPFLNQLQDYYKAGGSAPQLDLTDVSVEARQRGLEVPTSSVLNQPIVFSDPTGIKQAVGWIGLIKLLGPIMALALIGLVAVIYRGWHRYSALAKIFLMAAFSEGLVFLLFKLTPGLLESIVKSGDAGPVAPILITFFKFILGDVGNDFGQAAIGFVAIAVLMLIVGLIVKSIHFAGRFGHHGEVAEIRPTPDNRPPVN